MSPQAMAAQKVIQEQKSVKIISKYDGNVMARNQKVKNKLTPRKQTL